MKGKKLNAILYLVVALFFILIITKQYYRKYLISDCFKVTIGTITKVSGGGKAILKIHYTFNSISQEIETEEMLDKMDYRKNGEDYYLNRRYFVKFYCEDPKLSEIVWDIKVPDTLNYIPPKCWDKIPYGLENVQIE
ncbi:hypothetical protein [Lacihabitans soyangensis]|uniref:Uncharacterized protein n=1 Tax=Lacihabitans soyangensis TaxID=869394 RepID=A0AAE3KXY5_9BACT|nr:hypothetical protein [Lacihabitans soyangensis]MCP9766105.1 hypothetical protein [Lacihabitans soyangensis]